MNPDLLLDAQAILGEGPFWHARRQHLFWVDIEGHLVHETDTATRHDRVIEIGEQVGCVAPAGDGLLVMGLRSGFVALDLVSGARAHIEDPEHHLPENRFNDGKCDPAGRFWAGTMATSEEPEKGALYCLDHALRVSTMVTSVSISNGLAWSLDEKTMYYVDSPDRRVVAFDYDVASGHIANLRPVYDVPAGMGFPDGMTIDTDGCLWVALWDGRRVIKIDPAAGLVVAEIAMPVSRPTSCAFGGSSLDELYITSASVNLSDEQRRREPHAGGIFVCRPGVAGFPAVEFGGVGAIEKLFG